MAKGLIGFSVEHRFYNSVNDDAIDNFFGIDGGANTQLGLSYAIQENLQVHVARASVEKEYTLGTTYALPSMNGVHPLVGLDFFSFKKLGNSSREQNFFYHISGTYPNVIPKLTPKVSIGIDGFNNNIGFAFGGEYEIRKSLFTTVEWAKTNKVTGNEHSVNLGLSKKTFGHQFILFVTNNSNVGFRRVLEGAQTKEWSLGFKVTRTLEWF
ncbi:hypothetical protein DID80_06655 [Candidatus Marinamargulisbacteria bacterium SCGC AAA071-K20]|nr:hypothetical protein DID80_06655 [Candidatus Marinamargulisbacteria bacterium SCGC AAA071-K20]